MSKVFLAARFGGHVTETGFVLERKKEILTYYNRLRADGASVFSSHINEAWGEEGLPPEECMRDDLRALTASDCLCALVDDSPSAGVAFELGYAASMRRPTVVVTLDFSRLSSMIRGMGELLDLQVVEGNLGDPAVVEKACTSALELASNQATSDRFWESADVVRALKFRSNGGR
ncbi:nucleoside 2-deoxyribosyltransferase [Actinopolyspora mortivallis]|uniref:nucleoside 2-deoxyribosyltransferase n=1 Tax=Actinopolyspora mortivallis TaxID=33906 RepID=UPI00035EFBCC|nr:nucleoside 2-deoxyribosyltransferase [Actinopolyspora mortivallis]